MVRLIAAALAFLALAGFQPAAAAPRAAKMTTSQPGVLVLEEWFAGKTLAQGYFINRIDGSRRDLTVKLNGRWDGKTLTLFEDFYYADGERDQKTWRFTKTGPGTYIGRREDVIGTAKVFTNPQGQVRLQYTAKVGSQNLSFDDTLALQPNGTVLNTANVSYLFLTVGQVELHFTRTRR